MIILFYNNIIDEDGNEKQLDVIEKSLLNGIAGFVLDMLDAKKGQTYSDVYTACLEYKNNHEDAPRVSVHTVMKALGELVSRDLVRSEVATKEKREPQRIMNSTDLLRGKVNV